MSAHDPYAALRYPDFLKFSLARVIAALGGQMQAVAVGWQIYELTRHPLALGLIGLAQVVPSIGLALLAGHIADRYSRKTILYFTQTTLVLGSFALIYATYAFPQNVLPLYLILFLEGFALGFQGPAGAALMPQIVSPAHFPNAVTWRTTIFQASALIGPMLGGYILHLQKNPAHVYACTALAGILSICGLIWMGSYPAQTAKQHEPLMQSLTGGIRYVRNNQVVLGAMTLDLFAVLFGGAVGLLPVFARDILHVGPLGLGALGSATSAGAILMAISLVHRPPIRRSGWTLMISVALFGVAMIGFGLSRNFWLSFFFLAVSGAVDNVSMVIRSTLIQGMTPNEMRGRVSAVNGIFVGASNELGRMESGVAATLLGTVPSVIFGGFMTLGVVALSAWRWPRLRNLGSLEEQVSR
ncbi:MAG: MFS transporter [Armatimonadetes bacterium]|nr:MFS transporter [Armatimonadota bacterium]